MSSDYELITPSHFNIKFKNFLRDIFIYQFKDKKTDYRVKGTGGKVDKTILPNTYGHASKRLRYIIEQKSEIEWSYGEVADLIDHKVNPKSINKCVECATVDSRKIAHNPFFLLYNHCAEIVDDESKRGMDYVFFYAVFFYFNLWKICEIDIEEEFTDAEVSCLEKYLKYLAENVESIINRHSPRAWKGFSNEKKEKFALEAIDRFMNKGASLYGTPTEMFKDSVLTDLEKKANLKKLRKKLIRYKQKIVYKNDHFSLCCDTSNMIQQDVLFEALSLFITVNKRQFTNKTNYLTSIGVLKREKTGQDIYYSLSEYTLSKILSDDEDFMHRFYDLVSFFSETSSLGEIGSFIQSKLPTNGNDIVFYKHNYFKSAINDYNLVDLLQSIHYSKQYIEGKGDNLIWCYLEYRNASNDDLKYQTFTCLPLQIRESVTDGRQFLVYYHLGYRSISAAPIDFIDRISYVSVDNPDFLIEDLKRAERLLEYTWGTSFLDFKKGNVKIPCEPNRVRIILSYKSDEKFIIDRVKRELRSCATCAEYVDDIYGTCIEIIALVVDTDELKKWLRSFITRIIRVEINGKRDAFLVDDIMDTYKAYFHPGLNSSENIPSRIGKELFSEDMPKENKAVGQLHPILFNFLNSVPFYSASKVLFELMEKESFSEKELARLEESFANSFKSPIFADKENKRIVKEKMTQIQNTSFYFTDKEAENIKSIFTFSDSDYALKIKMFLPLSRLEIQWMYNILSHPLAQCFLTDEEITELKGSLEDEGLFDVNVVMIYDQFRLPENKPQDARFCEIVRCIFSAIRDNRKIKVEYVSQNGNPSNNEYLPSYVEYSKRDNKFRIRAVRGDGKVTTLNVERILNVTILDEHFDPIKIKKDIDKHIADNTKELIVYFNETKNIPSRILTEFSCFKKRCMKWGEGRYRMTLSYDDEDKREHLIRLLSYGPYVTVSEDSGEVRSELIGRLKSQLELFGCKDFLNTMESGGRTI